tara:strand:- start:699 stop:893 length:195 start_codon:yes stop_codon:yes gene_type:complete
MYEEILNQKEDIFSEKDSQTLLKFNKQMEKEKKKEERDIPPKEIFENFKKMIVKKFKKKKTKSL